MHQPIGVVILAVVVAATIVAHITSILLVIWRTRRLPPVPSPIGEPAISILRPFRGLENNLAETLASGFALDYRDYEILFCVASADDAAIPLVKGLMAAHPARPARLLIGDDPVSINPKLNNLVKGWKDARHDWIVMADSNVLMPSDYLQRLFERWSPGTGLIASPAAGAAPQSFWAEVECAFLNTYQGRWQLAADQVGLGFAQGKNMLWQRDLLEEAGGIAALAAEAAEDVAATKIVHRAGLKVRLVRMPFPQPLGIRSLGEVWRRQLRWARLRRVGLKAYFIPEVLSGGLFPIGATAAMGAAGVFPLYWAALLGVAWYGAEFALARLAGWPGSARSVLTWVIRDFMLPVVWVLAWTGSTFVWRGNAMAVNGKPARLNSPSP